MNSTQLNKRSKKTTPTNQKKYNRNTKEAEQKLSPNLVPSGSFVRFQTNYKDKIIQDSGYIVSSIWKNEKTLSAIYDISTKQGYRIRIITDKEEYPKDTIIY